MRFYLAEGARGGHQFAERKHSRGTRGRGEVEAGADFADEGRPATDHAIGAEQSVNRKYEV